jgi:hypothetical protein
MLKSLPLGRFIRFVVSDQPSLLQESPQPRKQTSPFPLCASARALPIRRRSAFSYAPMGFSDGLSLSASLTFFVASCLRVRSSLAHSLRKSRMPHTKPRSRGHPSSTRLSIHLQNGLRLPEPAFFRAGSSWSRRLMQFIPNRRAYDDLLQTSNLLGVLGVLAVPLMGSAITGLTVHLDSIPSASCVRAGEFNRQDAKGEGPTRLDMT